MIFRRPAPDDPVDQGDMIDGCPLLAVSDFDARAPQSVRVKHAVGRVVVLTQTCDLANQKATQVVVAVVLNADAVVESGLLKSSDIRGPVRTGRVFGWYFLPRSQELDLGEMIVDFRQLHTIRLDLLTALCAAGQRRARIEPLYREHLSKHFADSYSRIGLPEPYETE